jgi:hypothetical protein
MKIIALLFLLITFPSVASIVGISTHPLNDEARVLTAEMMGFMSNRHEVGMGLRYTQEMGANKLLDITAGGGQESRSLTMGVGVDFALLEEDVSQPRVSIKPYIHYLKYEDSRQNLIGAAPTIRKGFSINGMEFFPYLALPTGMRLDSGSEKFDYYASLTLGASMPFPGADTNKLLLSLEGNRDMGASSDYIGCMVSWVWK